MAFESYIYFAPLHLTPQPPHERHRADACAAPIAFQLTDDTSAMDLNQLYFDHQLAVMRTGTASSCELRRDRQFDASLIAGRIGSMQGALGARAAPGWETLATAPGTGLTSRPLALRAPGQRDGFSPDPA